VFCIAVFSCESVQKLGKGLEGKIVYDLTFPYEEQSVLMDLYPTEMVFHFKDELMHSEIRSSYDILTTDLIIDHDDKTFIQMLKNMSKRVAMKLGEDETIAWYQRYPKYSFEQTGETINIAGYVCVKTIAKADADSLPAIELYHTKGLGIETSNWWNPFSQIDGFLLGYDVEQYGMCMRLRAREVSFEKIAPEKFTLPANYEIITPDLMNKELNEVIAEFVK
jgi:hypothetical protein